MYRSFYLIQIRESFSPKLLSLCSLTLFLHIQYGIRALSLNFRIIFFFFHTFSHFFKLFLSSKQSSMANCSSIENQSHLPEMDYSNPFFLHHRDSPRAILVSQQLIGDNYGSWKRAMTIGFNSKEQNRLHQWLSA